MQGNRKSVFAKPVKKVEKYHSTNIGILALLFTARVTLLKLVKAFVLKGENERLGTNQRC